MNKAELIEALAPRLGDRKTATSALDAVLGEVQAAVTKGDRVAITGFGVFEKRVRGPRTARNPRTGEAVKVKKTSVPTFRPGSGFKEMVASGKVPKNTMAAKKATGAAKAAPTKAAAKKTAGAKAAPTRPSATKATARKAAGQKAAAKKTAAKKAATTKAAAKKTTKATAAKKSAAGATKRTAGKKATARR